MAINLYEKLLIDNYTIKTFRETFIKNAIHYKNFKKFIKNANA